MRELPVAHLECGAKFLVIAALLAPLPSCAALGLVGPAAVVATPLATSAITGDPIDSGKFAAFLPDGTKLEGRWRLVARLDSLSVVAIQTPRGRVTAAQLAAPERPAFTGRIHEPSVRMICAFVGDAYSGYRCHCVDNAGGEWSGTFRGRNWLVKGYYRDVAVSLHEVALAPCPPCNQEVDRATRQR